MVPGQCTEDGGKAGAGAGTGAQGLAMDWRWLRAGGGGRTGCLWGAIELRPHTNSQVPAFPSPTRNESLRGGLPAVKGGALPVSRAVVASGDLILDSGKAEVWSIMDSAPVQAEIVPEATLRLLVG